MQYLRWGLAIALSSAISLAATLGTVVPVLGGASDLVLDEGRGRLYLVNTTQNRVEVYSLTQRRLLSPIQTDTTPISAAISRNHKFLYVTALNASALDTIDLDSLTIANRVALPAQPEGVAVGSDERVLISTIGTGGNTNSLLIYDPSSTGPSSLLPVPVPPAPPLPPQLPAPSQREFLASRSQLTPTKDGGIIIGANIPTGTARVVFVYEVASGSVLRTRLVSNASAVVTVAPDGSKFMSGSTLFDTATLQVLAQENLANAPYLVQSGTNFNTQTVQGGSVFSPDGSVIYAAFNTSPQTNPATPAKVSEFMFNDPDNLLIQMALQIPENLAGKMTISSDGATVYALSDSGFTIIPVSTTFQNPIAIPDSTVLMLANDQCGVIGSQSAARVTVGNAGKGRMTATAQLIQSTPTGTAGLGGGGAGGGIIGGGGIIIILPPAVPPATGSAATIFQTAPPERISQTGSGATIDFSFNPLAARALGTISPSHDFAIQSPEAINVPPRVRIYQNNRDAEARGTIIPVPLAISDSEGLVDMVYDFARQRLYIANSGMNRVEVFDIRQQQFLAPIKVGQLPRSLALTPDGNTLYVANSGGESISIVDPDKMQAVGRVKFPPVPLFLNLAIQTPSMMAAGLRGPLFLMTVAAANGTSANTIWQIVGDTAVPRGPSAVIGTAGNGLPSSITGPAFMANTPGGEYVLLISSTGMAYLYDALADDFVQSRQLAAITQTPGYFGPITAGPRGQYYIVNGTILNSSLTPLNQPQTGTGAPAGRPVAAAVALNASTFARFTEPLRTNAATLPGDAGTVEIADANTGIALRSFPALEGPLSQASTNGRATTIDGRTMAVDSAGSNAYVLTTTGLSIIPLTPLNTQNSPRVFAKGAVNLASYQSTVAQNGLLAIFGTNLSGSGIASTLPLPYVLGNTCVTLNNVPLPLFYTSAGQINAQIPPELNTGNYSLVIHAIDRNQAAPAQQVAIAKYAPAVFVDGSGQAAILHADGRFVTKDHPANRDEPLVLYAAGLGLTTGGKVTAGNPSPGNPLAVTAKVQVFFGDPRYTQSEVIVDWSGLAPGFVGLYQLNVRVPGFHMKGEALPVTLRINNVNSPSAGSVVPVVAVD